MSKPDPRLTASALLAVSQHLLAVAEDVHPAHADVADAMRRRAVSTAYYALFHEVCHAIAEKILDGLLAEDRTALHNQAYRLADHGPILAVAKRVMTQSRSAQPVANLCALLVEIYEARLSADYDPSYTLNPDDARAHVESASSALPYFMFGDSGHGDFNARARLVAELLAPPKLSRAKQQSEKVQPSKKKS